MTIGTKNLWYSLSQWDDWEEMLRVSFSLPLLLNWALYHWVSVVWLSRLPPGRNSLRSYVKYKILSNSNGREGELTQRVWLKTQGPNSVVSLVVVEDWNWCYGCFWQVMQIETPRPYHGWACQAGRDKMYLHLFLYSFAISNDTLSLEHAYGNRDVLSTKIKSTQPPVWEYIKPQVCVPFFNCVTSR